MELVAVLAGMMTVVVWVVVSMTLLSVHPLSLRGEPLGLVHP